MCLGPYVEHDHTNEDTHISGHFRAFKTGEKIIFSPVLWVLGASNVVRYYQVSEQWCYFEELTDFIRLMTFWIWKMSKFYHIRSPDIRKMHFWGTSGCCMVLFACIFPLHQVLQSVWGVNQVSTAIGSRDMNFATFFPCLGYFRLTDRHPKYGTCFFWLSESRGISF